MLIILYNTRSLGALLGAASASAPACVSGSGSGSPSPSSRPESRPSDVSDVTAALCRRILLARETSATWIANGIANASGDGRAETRPTDLIKKLAIPPERQCRHRHRHRHRSELSAELRFGGSISKALA